MPIMPTSYKTAISKQMSFVLGAETVSDIFADAPQFDLFALSFNNAVPRQEAASVGRLVVRIRFYRSGPSISTPQGSKGQPWSLEIYPVPRNIRAAIKKSLLEDIFPNHVLPWLRKIGRLDGQEGRLMIDVYFDPITRECKVQQYDEDIAPAKAR